MSPPERGRERIPPLLELRGIHAGYGGIEVLHGVDLTVEAGTVLAVLGPNGAGKTTLLRVASAMLAPTRGDLVVGGRVLTGVEPGALARPACAPCPRAGPCSRTCPCARTCG